MSDREPRTEGSTARAIASEFMSEARTHQVNILRDIYFRDRGLARPEIVVVLSAARSERIPGSNTPQEKAYRMLLGIKAAVGDKFANPDSEKYPFKFSMLSAPDMGDDIIAGRVQGFEKLEATPST